MPQATIKAKEVPYYSQDGISGKKNAYLWQKRIPFPVSEEYKKRLDKNGFYRPVKNSSQGLFREWEDDPKSMKAYLENLPNDKRYYVAPIGKDYFKQFEKLYWLNQPGENQALDGKAAIGEKILEMVPLEDGLAQEKTSVGQRLQEMLSAMGSYFKERFGKLLGGESIGVPEGS